MRKINHLKSKYKQYLRFQRRDYADYHQTAFDLHPAVKI